MNLYKQEIYGIILGSSLIVILFILILIKFTPVSNNEYTAKMESIEMLENYKNDIDYFLKEYKELHRKYQELAQINNVTITAYSPSIEETNENPDKTAIMEKPVIGYTCAVSRDLMYLLGKKIYIENVGVYKVNDLMNKRYKKRIDLCMNKKDAIAYGVNKSNLVVIH